MNDNKKQLADLLTNDTWSDAERKLMLDYLESCEASELQELMSEQFTENSPLHLDPSVSQKLLQDVHERLGIGVERKRPISIKKWVVRIAVAASLLMVISVGLKMIFQGADKPFVTQQATIVGDSSIFKHEINETDTEKPVRLPDSSLIILASNSEITYRVPFTDKRDITLIGKAYFKVAKDKTRPFTVFSGVVSTTALGTEFIVTAYPKSLQLKVRLFEGKVVVKAVDKGNKRMKKEVYLLPGQEFVYSEQVMAKVTGFKQKANATAIQNLTDEQETDRPSIPEEHSDYWYMFNNQSLEKVLDDLAGMYNKKIRYNKADVQKVYFTGRYNKSDSLSTILERIAKLNNLRLIKSDTAYTIVK